MATLAERILEAIRYAPLDDDVLAKRLGVAQRQSINQTARRMESQGLIRRVPGPDGKLVNALPNDSTLGEAATPVLKGVGTPLGGRRITEDEVKAAVEAHLREEGFRVQVAWGRTRGIDIEAVHQDGRRCVIEAKAEVGTAGPQQVNYFLGMLGELLQRMDDPNATYGIALPDNRQYRGLVDRLPLVAKARLGLVVFWVSRAGGELHVTVQDERS